MYIILAGNPFDGYNAIGPFDSFDSADEYAQMNITGENWISELTNPKES